MNVIDQAHQCIKECTTEPKVLWTEKDFIEIIKGLLECIESRDETIRGYQIYMTREGSFTDGKIVKYPLETVAQTTKAVMNSISIFPRDG